MKHKKTVHRLGCGELPVVCSLVNFILHIFCRASWRQTLYFGYFVSKDDDPFGLLPFLSTCFLSYWCQWLDFIYVLMVVSHILLPFM